MAQPRRCFMHFHVAGSTQFICHSCRLCSRKGHILSGVSSQSKMFQCSMLWCVCWTRIISCDSPASFLCSCGVWSPVCLLLWLHCVCGNNYSDLLGIKKSKNIQILIEAQSFAMWAKVKPLFYFLNYNAILTIVTSDQKTHICVVKKVWILYFVV